MELFIVGIVGAVVATLLYREFGGNRHTASGYTPHETKSIQATQERPQDWMTDPSCCWMLGNIYYQSLNDDEMPSQLPDSSQKQSDWLTDPVYSSLPGNIFHNDDHFSSSASSFADDDTWSSSFDDSWSSSSSFHDD